jgi:hypothetical protein
MFLPDFYGKIMVCVLKAMNNPGPRVFNLSQDFKNQL